MISWFLQIIEGWKERTQRDRDVFFGRVEPVTPREKRIRAAFFGVLGS